MPLTRIEVCQNRPADEVQYILQSVYEAQIEAFKVPESDRQLRYYELLGRHFFIPPGRTDNFTLVSVDMFPGRTAEAKKAFYSSVVRRLEKIGIAPSDVFINLVESARENWSMRDGISAADA
ncbi:tautomerase family protein [Burkholderia orbicola]|uniref:tautomerase family protein n=1 Tax=Burkholderia orbicola TaxID=2978683 RepID=UPI0026512A87|nr:tautomerase family protein [Burkholderia orbicola]MDN7559103.1 tautomerase family protein [Burkholderia orbicola]